MRVRSVWRWFVGRVVRVAEITMDIITEDDSDKVSAPKLAAATGHLVGTIFFCYYCLTAAFNLNLWLVYYGVVVGHMSVETWLQQRPGIAATKAAVKPQASPVPPVAG